MPTHMEPSRVSSETMKPNSHVGQTSSLGPVDVWKILSGSEGLGGMRKTSDRLYDCTAVYLSDGQISYNALQVSQA